MSIITLEDYNNDKDCPELVDAYDFTYTDSLCQHQPRLMSRLNLNEMLSVKD
jgi:hypothetical protein